MANFEALKTLIRQYIKENGDGEITGDILQSVLIAMVTEVEGNGYVYAGIATPTTEPVTGNVFYIATEAGSYSNFGSVDVSAGITILKRDGTSWTKNQISYTDGVFDISAYNGSSYADLDAALTALNALHAQYKYGGMSFKFVSTSDNKYVQYRLMSENFNTNPVNWQGVTNNITPESEDLITSGAIDKMNRPYSEPVILQEGEDLTTIGTKDSSKATITKDGGTFTAVKTVSEQTGGAGFYIGILDYDYHDECYLSFDYSYTKYGSPTAVIDVRTGNTSSDSLCGSVELTEGSHSAKIALSRTLAGKYIYCKFNSLGNAGTTVVLSNIKITKEDNSTIAENLVRIDNAIHDVEVGTEESIEHLEGVMNEMVNELSEDVDARCDNIEAELKTTEQNLQWQLTSMAYAYKVMPENNAFVQTSGGLATCYAPCKKGELFRVSVVATPSSNNVICFSQDIPVVGGICTISKSLTTVGDYYVTAPYDGYIGIYRYYLIGNCPLLYSVTPSLALIRYFKEELSEPSFTQNKFIECNTESANYGTLVNAGNNEWGVSDPIDVSNCAYIGVPIYYQKASFFADNSTHQMAGGMFFDAGYKEDGSYDEGDNVSNHVVGFPIIGVKCATDTSATYIGAIIKVPTGAKYYRQFCYLNALHKKIVIYTENSNISPSIIEPLINQTIADNASKIGEKTIFETNPDTEMYQKMVLAKKPRYIKEGTESTIIPLVLAHASDIHGTAVRYNRFVEFANHWKTKGYIDELIDTGDVVASDYTNGVSWRTAISGTDKIMTVVGNHDTRAGSAEASAAGLSGYSLWGYHSSISVDSNKRIDVYNQLIRDNVSNWNVTQPTDAANNGLCYYYKDYTEKNIRLIALDVMGFNSAECDWLQARLAEAKTAGYHVVILAHFTATAMDGLSCNYTSLFGVGEFGVGLNQYLDSINPYAIPQAVNAFQEDGGVFIGYIIGHYHRDMVNVIHNYPKQLVFAVSSAGYTNIADWTKKEGCKSYDDFQIVSINTYDKTVRLIKIGADTDYFMRKKGTLCVGYTLVKEDGTVPAEGETATKIRGIIGEGW